MSEKILIVLHQKASTPGRVGHMLRRRGFELDFCRPRFGDLLPETLDDHAGVVCFGGPMSANDDEDYVHQEIDWIDVPLKEKAPFIGICLGAQMFAKNLGGSVGFHPDGEVEIGYRPLEVTQAGRALLDWPKIVYHWNREGFTVPDSATILACGDIFDQQAFSYGPAAYGIQFHSELTLAMMHRWTVLGAERLEMPKAQPAEAHLEGRLHHGRSDPDMARRISRYVAGQRPALIFRRIIRKESRPPWKGLRIDPCR